MNQRIKILIGLIIGYFVVSIICNFIYKNETVVYIGDYTKVYVDGEKITVKNENYKVDNIEVKTLFDKEFVPSYLFSTDIDNTYSYYVVDKNKSSLHLADIYAISGNLDIKVYDYLNEITKNDEITKINENLPQDKGNLKYTYSEKYIFKNQETNKVNLYAVYASSDTEDYVIFMVEDNLGISVLDYSTINSEVSDGRVVSFNNIIDFNNDDIYEIVLKEKTGDDKPTYYHIYEYDGSEYQEVEVE